jgi:hypothetical protein
MLDQNKAMSHYLFIGPQSHKTAGENQDASEPESTHKTDGVTIRLLAGLLYPLRVTLWVLFAFGAL